MGSLPDAYVESMKELLGEEYRQYLDSFSQSPFAAFRINTIKISVERWKEIAPFSATEVAWTKKGFYYDVKKDMPSKHPYYYAGLYYIQEPSAMIPASILPVVPGDKVLDLCAAPGGKATELGAKLNGTGLLVANDLSVSRTMALAKNLQVAGISNAVVTTEAPERLCGIFEGFFDKILVDAPCSGEGMFRREPKMIKDWLTKGPEYYEKIQKQILSDAWRMLRPGGYLVYSTCTFSVTEDEKVVQWLLGQYQDMEICPIERKEGFCEGRPDLVENGAPELKNCIRIFPHLSNGEGHFAVLLRKQGIEKEKDNKDANNERDQDALCQFREELHQACHKAIRGCKAGQEEQKEMEDFLYKLPLSRGIICVHGSSVSLVPKIERDCSGLRVICQGLPLCEWKHKLSISHQLALLLKDSDFGQVLNLRADDERVIRYLKGETIFMEEKYRGNVLVCVDGFGLGWGQGNGQGTLKNKYYPGWRYQ